MKKLLLSLLLLISVSVMAQEHMKFKGIPIDGTLKEFTTKLQSKGFTYKTTNDGVTLLSGEFAGYKGCTIVAAMLKSTGKVNVAGVLFPDKDTWGALYNNYTDLKEMLTEKYGEPARVVEYFDRGSSVNDDNDRMFELKMDRCTYFTLFETENGDIELEILHSSYSNCFVRLRYFDKINNNAARSAAMDDL